MTVSLELYPGNLLSDQSLLITMNTAPVKNI